MATRARLTHNIGDTEKALQGVLGRLEPTLRRVASYADQRIAARALSIYMKNSAGGPRAPEDTDARLRIVSGDLARAVSGKEGSIVKFDWKPARQTLEYSKEILLPYARIQHDGGTIRLRVTSRMRKFFWAMFIRTRDEKWKAMALSRKTHFIIKIPARPYLDPALDDETANIINRAEVLLYALLVHSLGG